MTLGSIDLPLGLRFVIDGVGRVFLLLLALLACDLERVGPRPRLQVLGYVRISVPFLYLFMSQVYQLVGFVC